MSKSVLILITGLVLLFIGLAVALKSSYSEKKYWAGLGLMLLGFVIVETGSLQIIIESY
jgi:uncharacterized membrane protein